MSKEKPILYKRATQLKNVILRIDYPSFPADKISIIDGILKPKYPIVKQLPVKKGEIQYNFDKDELNRTIINSFERIYQDTSKTKSIKITESYIGITYTKYKDRSDLLKDVDEFIQKIIDALDIKTINKIGLRYVNILDNTDAKELSDRKQFVNKKLTTSLEFSTENTKTVRSLSQIHLTTESSMIIFRYGVFNKDYPSDIINQEFVLDIDSQTIFPIDATDKTSIISTIDQYNKNIQKIFETAITEKYRNIIK
ncbi:MAG TPA: TIGR04255 family protein [Candidatus Absconditabacterales bacterium]|nr:TIGR04255 family protein [Candidatus Absconditabacterales bacterium]HMT27030.1 TIGR04255 family protein [Candidatus Absconditabacterales bacterium]